MNLYKLFASLIALLCISINVFAQSNALADKDLVRGAEDLKSGNYKDVLTSFFQLASSDITSENKSFEFKSTLFGIKLRADSTLIVDTNYVRETFSRNLQFGFKINTDDNFKPKSFTGGITYALLNKRDRTLADFRGARYEQLENFLGDLAESQTAFFNSDAFRILSNEEKGKVTIQISNGMDYYNTTGKTDSLPQLFQKYLSEEKFNKIQSVIDSAYNEIDKKPLWTLSVNSSASESGNVFDNLSFETVFLQGVPGDAFEADIRGNLDIKDTIAGNDDSRINLSAKAGINIHLVNHKKNGRKSGKHLIEIKPHIEYSKIFEGILPGEEEEKFLANAEIRIHITDQLWFPVTIKYDITEHNVFGFLNITWNLDVFKNFLSGASNN